MVNSKQDAVLKAAQEFDPSGKVRQRSKWLSLVLEYLGDDELPIGGIFALYGRAIGFLWATNKRLLYAGRGEGLFSRRTLIVEHSYDRITSIEATKKHSALSMIKVKIGEEGVEFGILPPAARSDEFIALVQERIPTITNTFSAPSSGDLVTQLERLSALRDQGKLTDAEYSKAKARILGIPNEMN